MQPESNAPQGEISDLPRLKLSVDNGHRPMQCSALVSPSAVDRMERTLSWSSPCLAAERGGCMPVPASRSCNSAFDYYLLSGRAPSLSSSFTLKLALEWPPFSAKGKTAMGKFYKHTGPMWRNGGSDSGQEFSPMNSHPLPRMAKGSEPEFCETGPGQPMS